ncbi:hypothetical protein LEP1GSC173_3056 [Leptospira interrogans str. HAI1594]|uniref:Uncharacterized protein n=9 Tax=Leptospira interrogans TaxID=173 RepID=M7A3S2_LEPIR|nr:hypothetical protein LEP1GSC080_3524 [Leptospira interrogans str. FPW2026]EKN85937.1 hypothetical protein LEP1GSC027_0156 [Leptospira interrogans str. 2002000624]EKO71111.1 hypothetical protein LEP1GSC069_0360 [Leptospira interrogans serovar Canicola str. Fiocruz LV133]EKO87190.1 hypothetical protein LEP1GSC009_3549 [Leptospira interrogans serovar Grippotyphosa str. Andaman]EKP24362.1 hypothetical protein LEP1GSC117_1565 [Leptospira interrogans serovar Icterohaemorrhagiae str. Verdun LP]EKP
MPMDWIWFSGSASKSVLGQSSVCRIRRESSTVKKVRK